jgi:hypothetical protein
MQASATYWQEYETHCLAILEVLAAAQVRYFPVEEESPLDTTVVCILPALRAFKVSHTAWKRFRTALQDEDYLRPYTYCHNARGEAFLVLPLGRLFPWLHHSRHPVATRFAVWQSGVQAALAQYGYYDPPTQHHMPPGRELDALEVKEGFHTLIQATFGPAIATWVAGTAETSEGH